MAKIIPSPRTNPNAYAGGSTAITAGLLIVEAQERFGFDLTEPEAIGIVSLATFIVLLVGRRVKPSGESPTVQSDV